MFQVYYFKELTKNVACWIEISSEYPSLSVENKKSDQWKLMYGFKIKFLVFELKTVILISSKYITKPKQKKHLTECNAQNWNIKLLFKLMIRF